MCNFCNRFHTLTVTTFIYKFRTCTNPQEIMPMKVFKMLLLFFHCLVFLHFPFLFSSSISFFILPFLQCFFFQHPCLVSTSYADRPIPYFSSPLTTPQNLSTLDIITSHHTLLWSSTRPPFNVLINTSQDKPEVIYCSCAHGPLEFHCTLKGTLPFKLFEISLCNLWWRSDMESPYARIAAKAFRIYIRIFWLFRNQWQSAIIKLTLHNTLSTSEMNYPCSV
jgi:hypothetical protein